MPIHINLLAEAQIAEDMRRRDPVKRAIFFGTLLVVLALVWWSSLLLESMIAKNDLSQVQQEIDARNSQWQDVLASQKKIFDARGKLASLQQLSNARFLQGNFLNALQQLNLDGVRLERIRVYQSYVNAPAVASKVSNNHTILGHPATSTEKIVVSLDVRDISASPGDQIPKFKEALASQAYFQGILEKTNGVRLASAPSAPQNGPDGKPYVSFTLECDLPEQIR